MSTCFLIDGLNLIFRCFYGIPLLSTQNFPTNAIFGSVKILNKIRDQYHGPIVFFFDKGRDPIRKELLPNYKANRLEVPDLVKIQIPVIKEFAYALSCTVIERSGIEADDLMASFANKYKNAFDEILIFSSDKDFAQCVHDNVYQIIPDHKKKDLGTRLDRKGVHVKFGVYPEQIVDYLSLIGDQADNIPGIRGVGPKTASKWLNQYESIARILENIDDIKPERFRRLLTSGAEDLRRNQQLIVLNNQINDIFLEETMFDEQKYQELLALYHLDSLKANISPEPLTQGDLFS